MPFKKILITIVFLSFFSFSQENKSIHQIEWENHEDDVAPLQKTETSLSKVSLNKDAFEQKSLTHCVFGYLPYWEYSNTPLTFEFDLLTHIAMFDFDVSSTSGAITNPPSWPWTQLIDHAHANGVKMIMVAVNFSGSEIHRIITDQTVKNNFFQNVKTIINTHNLDGINIDFESLQTADRGILINTFMAELTDYVHNNIGSEKEVSFAAPAVNWGGWDFVGLANSCDYLFIMGYDFHGSWSANAGPSAPLIGGSYNITRTLNDASSGYANVVSSMPQKLILGVPYYGNKWRTSSPNQGATALEYIGSRRFRTVLTELGSQDPLWSNTYRTPWYTSESSGNYYQTWFDNDSSLALKYDLAKNKNLKGVGMWALNYDQYRSELWDLLRRKFYDENLDTTDIDDKPGKFKLYQNYPNPFNPITTIEYFLKESKDIEINIYNISGRKITTLISSYQNAGKHGINFNASGLASGTYLYQIISGSHSEIKKMLLIK